MTASVRIPSALHGVAGSDPFRHYVELLSDHPDAMVLAFDEHGVFVPVPAAVPITGHRVPGVGSLLDLIVPTDHLHALTRWACASSDKGCVMRVHLVDTPDRASIVAVVDARDSHGAYLGVVLPDDDPGLPAADHAEGFPAARTARVRKDAFGTIQEIDSATTRILGWRPEEMVGKRSIEFIHPDDQELSTTSWMEMLASPGFETRVRLRQLAADGSWIWMEFTNRNRLDSDDPCVLGEMLDISEELAAQEALRASEQRLRRLAGALPVGVLQIELDGSIAYANTRLAEITGVIEGGSVNDYFARLLDDDRATLDAAIARTLSQGVDRDVSIRLAVAPGCVPGNVRHCTMSLRALTSDTGAVTGAIACVTDVTDQVLMTSELEHRATFDALTGCHNRRSVMGRLEAMLLRPGGVAIVFVDLDGFKAINDERGHAAGDELLIGIAARLREAVRDGDIVGRVGGDEFLLVCRDIADMSEALSIATRIESLLEQGVTVEGEHLVVRASLGVAHTIDQAMSSDQLVAEADARMYVEKRGRKERRTSEPAARSATKRTRWAEEAVALRHALEDNQFSVHYQPIVHLPSHEIFGLEALVRWHRDGQVLPAAAFIGVAERAGLITELGARVTREVVQTVAATPLPTPTGDHARWFINLSPQELALSSRVDELVDAIERYGVDAEQLVVEVTQHADLMQSPAAIDAVQRLAALGVAIALDDFGTGFASFEVLRTLPVSLLKFDGSFTAHLGTDPVADHLLAVCLDLSSRLDIRLIVEGVETPEQRDHLVTAGVELAQGYLFGFPQPVDDLHIHRFV